MSFCPNFLREDYNISTYGTRRCNMSQAPVVQALANQSMVNTSYIALAAHTEGPKEWTLPLLQTEENNPSKETYGYLESNLSTDRRQGKNSSQAKIPVGMFDSNPSHKKEIARFTKLDYCRKQFTIASVLYELSLSEPLNERTFPLRADSLLRTHTRKREQKGKLPLHQRKRSFQDKVSWSDVL